MAKLFEIWAELGLDSAKFNKGVTSATKQGKSMSDSLSVGMQKISAKTIALGNAMYDMGKQAARAVANFAKDAVGAYAEAEQLLGGVETLFKDSASTVIDNARKAYTTAGMDANQYMQTVMGFSSSLLQSVGGDTVKAAQYADMAIRDMSDNANKFGTDMASIENAYQGFAKQNFTLLDNLRLGYGGTKTEMQRLLKDAQKIQRAQGNNVRYSINNLADIYDAIHVIQESMGVTGTTSEEAAKTIAGSFNAFKASWKNLVIGMGTGEEMNILVENLFTTGTTLLQNIAAIAPRIGQQALRSFDAILQKYDIYRTLREAYKVGKWQGLASAAVSSLKKGVSGFGEWASEKGSEFLAGLWQGLTGNEADATKIKAFLDSIFGGVGTVLTGIQGAVPTVLQWVKENGESVSTAVSAMAVAFAALELATSPLALALTGIIAFTTDWAQFETKAPAVVSFFESLAGIEFSEFVSGITALKTALTDIGNYMDNNPELVSGISTLAAAVAFATGHPAIAAGLLGVGYESAQTASDQFAAEQSAMDAWAAERGYQRTEQPYFLFPSWKTGEPDYPLDVYEEYYKWQQQNAIDQIRNATPSGEPATITGPGGREVPLMPTSSSDGVIGELSSLMSTLASVIEGLPAAVGDITASTMTSVTVEMDGHTVGRLVSEHLSREYRQSAATTA